MARILLVDDEPGILSALKRTLRKENIDIHTAASGRDALALLQGAPFDLVVSDQKMPGERGIELLARVATDWPDTERILLSGWSAEIPPAELKSARLFATLAKPWDDEELKATIRAALNA